MLVTKTTIPSIACTSATCNLVGGGGRNVIVELGESFIDFKAHVAIRAIEAIPALAGRNFKILVEGSELTPDNYPEMKHELLLSIVRIEFI